jgi:6-phosphogluconolactonase (cycloisomerase 2 family)
MAASYTVPIAAMTAATNRLLTPVGWEPTQGSTARFIGLDPTGRFLYAANEAGDTVVTVTVEASGKLTATGQVVKNGSPVTIVFAGAP